MKFRVVGAHKETGDDVDVQLVAASSKGAESLAIERGIMVSSIKPVADELDLSPIAMIDDPPAGSAPAVAVAKVAAAPAPAAAAPHAPPAHADHSHSHGPAQAPHHAGAGHDPAHHDGQHHDAHHHDHTPHPPGHLEYKLMQNQALFLLEKSVNKMILEGWEPCGGLTIAISNNAPNFFQALIRWPKEETAAAPV